MTDFQISKALALAIGWRTEHILCHDGRIYVDLAPESPHSAGWREFDHKDWSVIGPIAERYNLFPYMAGDGLWYVQNPALFDLADTPQKAIAMAVIERAKK